MSDLMAGRCTEVTPLQIVTNEEAYRELIGKMPEDYRNIAEALLDIVPEEPACTYYPSNCCCFPVAGLGEWKQDISYKLRSLCAEFLLSEDEKASGDTK